MSSDMVSNSIKNGILFVLVILIVHFATRNAIDDKIDAAQPPQRSSTMVSPLLSSVSPFVNSTMDPAPIPSTAHSSSVGDGSDLMAYVFGEKGDPRLDPSPPVPQSLETSSRETSPMLDYASTLPPPPSLPSPPVPSPMAPPIPSGGPGLASSSDASTNGGCLVVGEYRNENVMCGGALYKDDPMLMGFDGTGSHFSNF